MIVLSAVRARHERLSDVRRMNVAISRAKYALWIVGSKRALSSNAAWKKLMDFAHAREVYKETTLPTTSIASPVISHATREPDRTSHAKRPHGDIDLEKADDRASKVPRTNSRISPAPHGEHTGFSATPTYSGVLSHAVPSTLIYGAGTRVPSEKELRRCQNKFSAPMAAPLAMQRKAPLRSSDNSLAQLTSPVDRAERAPSTSHVPLIAQVPKQSASDTHSPLAKLSTHGNGVSRAQRPSRNSGEASDAIDRW